MSTNPFRDTDGNPYESPQFGGAGYDEGDGTNPLLLPGIFLAVLSSLFLVVLAVSGVGQVALLGDLDIDPATPEGIGHIVGTFGTLATWIGTNVAILIGSISMMRLRGYKRAFTAGAVSVIPLCSPCFVVGIPFGIWALVVLVREDVKRRFQ